MEDIGKSFFYYRIVFFIMLILIGCSAYSQGDSLTHLTVSPKRPVNLKKILLVPSAFITAGLIAATDNDVFDRYEIHAERQEHLPYFRTHIDNYLQYTPIAAVYALNLAGVKGAHNIVNQTALIIKSELFMMAMVLPLKKLTAVPRPDTGAPTSFPSGHTAQAFAAATFLHMEYGKDHPLYSVLAYTAATSVGVLRVMNNRHWVSDVLAGAGIGILSTNLAYATHRNKWGKKHSKLSGMTLAPSYSHKSVGLYLALPVH
jgi:membrane-associated phospholipid phosphatase